MIFEDLMRDRAFQQGPCSDAKHQIFLHQAILSTLVATIVGPARIRLLPPGYSFPYNLQARVPAAKRAQTFDELTCIAYEERPLDPTAMDDIEVSEPWRSWLADRF